MVSPYWGKNTPKPRATLGSFVDVMEFLGETCELWKSMLITFVGEERIRKYTPNCHA